MPRVPPRQPARPERQVQALVRQIEQLRPEIEATLPELDEKVRAQVSFVAEHEVEAEADTLRAALSDGSSPELPEAARSAHALGRFHRELLHAGRTHTTLRRRRELQGPRLVADRP